MLKVAYPFAFVIRASMKKKLISYKESAHPYYDIKDYEGDTGVNYVQYQKSQRSLARCILYSLIILIGLALCGFGLAVWWKDTQFCNKKSKKNIFCIL